MRPKVFHGEVARDRGPAVYRWIDEGAQLRFITEEILFTKFHDCNYIDLLGMLSYMVAEGTLVKTDKGYTSPEFWRREKGEQREL
jgi:dsRNA-specific ribonuclease